MSSNLREYTNGTLLPRFNDKNIAIIGLVTKANPNGLSFEMRSTDDVPLKVNFRKPFTDIPKDYVLVLGVAQGRTIICDDCFSFPFENSSSTDFDTNGYNKLCNAMNTVPQLYKTTMD